MVRGQGSVWLSNCVQPGVNESRTGLLSAVRECELARGGGRICFLEIQVRAAFLYKGDSKTIPVHILSSPWAMYGPRIAVAFPPRYKREPERGPDVDIVWHR